MAVLQHMILLRQAALHIMPPLHKLTASAMMAADYYKMILHHLPAHLLCTLMYAADSATWS